MASFRLDNYEHERLLSSEVVDAVDSDDLAVRLLLTHRTARQCKLYRNDLLIAEMDKGVWANLPVGFEERSAPLKQDAPSISNSGALLPIWRWKRASDSLSTAPKQQKFIASVQSQIAKVRVSRRVKEGGVYGQVE